MLSDPALQIVRRTTPRGSRVDAAIGIEHLHGILAFRASRCALPGQYGLLSRFAGRSHRIVKSGCDGGIFRRVEIKLELFAGKAIVGYYMTANIQ